MDPAGLGRREPARLPINLLAERGLPAPIDLVESMFAQVDDQLFVHVAEDAPVARLAFPGRVRVDGDRSPS